MNTKPAIQKIFKGILLTKDEDRHSYESMGKNKSHR
jgi:hypothetical protein